jgi:hypothetical protein
LVAEQHGSVVGFVCGTLTRAAELTAEAMATHDAEGTTLCVHSVCVAAASRRQGVALAMLRTYVTHVVPAVAPAVRAVRLIAKPYLHELYTRANFALLGLSPVVHGSEAWNEYALAYENAAP